MNPQNTDNVPTSVDTTASSSGNLATMSSPTMTPATSNNVSSFNDILNSEYTTVLPTNAPVKRFIRKITHIDHKKLQQAGLDRKIAEAIREQKLQMGGARKPSQATVTSCNKLATSASSSVIKSVQTTNAAPIETRTSIQATLITPTETRTSIHAIQPTDTRSSLQATTTPTRPSSSSPSLIQPIAPPSPTAYKPLTTKTIIPPKITITAPEANVNESDRNNMEGLSPQQRLKHVKHMLNKKLLLKKISNHPGMTVHLQPPAPNSPTAPKPKKLMTLANTPTQSPPKGFINLIEPTAENTPNKPVTKNKTLQKSPQDIARKLDFPTEVEKPNIIQYIRKNPMKFINKNDNQSPNDHFHKLPDSTNDDIPKASIKPAKTILNHNIKQIMQSRQKIEYPEVSPLKIPFPTANVPVETPLPTIDTFKKPYPMSDTNYYHLHSETHGESDPTRMEYITENYEILTPIQQKPNTENVMSRPSSSSPNCLIVLENKILSQDEMIDLTALRLSTSKTPQRFARPHKPIPEVVIKQEKPDDFPSTTNITSQNAKLQKDLTFPSSTSVNNTEMVQLPAKRNRKIIVNAQKLKLPQEKIAELAKKIAQSTGTKTKPTHKRSNKINLLENIKIQGKNPEMSLTNDIKPKLFNLQRTTAPASVTTEAKLPSNPILSTNLFPQPSLVPNKFVIVKQEPKTPQISPPKELTVNSSDFESPVIKPLPSHGLQKLTLKTYERKVSPFQYNSSFTGNRKSAAEILDDPSDTEDSFSAVDFLAAFVDTNPITEETTLELSPEELNLSASCAMNLSPLRIPSYMPGKKRVYTPQKQMTIPSSTTSSSSLYIKNDSSSEIGKIVALQDVDINTENLSFSMDNSQSQLNTILIQSSKGPETILTKTNECKCPHITIPANKLKPVRLLNTLDSTKMSPAKLRDYGLNQFTTNKQSAESNNKVNSSELEKSDILENSQEHVNAIMDKTEMNLLNNSPIKLSKKLVSFKSQEKTSEEANESLHEQESITKTDGSIQTTVTNKSPKKSVKSILKSQLATDMEQALNCAESLDIITPTNLSNITTEKSLEVALKTPVKLLEKSVKTPVKPDDNITQTNLSYHTTEKSTQETVKTPVKVIEKSVKTPVKLTDKPVKSTENPASSIEIDQNFVVLESSENKDSNPSESVGTKNTVKDDNLSAKTSVLQKQENNFNHLEASQSLEHKYPKDDHQTEDSDTNKTSKDLAKTIKSPKTSAKSPVKTPEKSINLKSILKLTTPLNVDQQKGLETSTTKDCPSQDRETPALQDKETTKSVQEAETPKTTESNSNNTGPSKRISRFKKGKINLVQRNKPGMVTKEAKPTSKDSMIRIEDKVETENQAQSESVNTRKSECVTKDKIDKDKIENVDKSSNEDPVQIGETLSESNDNNRTNECATGNLEVGNEDNDNTENKVGKEDSLKGSRTKKISETDKIMEEKTTTEEVTISIKDQLKETSKVDDKDINKPVTQPIDLQSQEDKLNDCEVVVSQQDETVTTNNENINNSSHLNMNTIEAGQEEKETEANKAITEKKDHDFNNDKAKTSTTDEVFVAEKPSESVELSSKDVPGEELLPTSEPIESHPSKDISHLIKPPKMPKRKSEIKNSDDLPTHSEQDLDESKQAKVSLANIVKQTNIETPPNPPKIPFKRKSSEPITNLEKQEPKGIKTLIKIKKSAEIDSKNVGNEKQKPKENEKEATPLKSHETKESTIHSTLLAKKTKTNENKSETDVSSEEPHIGGKEIKRRSGRSTLQKAETSLVKANESSKNPESPLMSRRSSRFSLNSKTEMVQPTPPLPVAKTRHSSRHQIISDDDLEFLPVNAEIKAFKETKTRKSLNDTSNIKEKTNDLTLEKTITRKRLSSKPLEKEDSTPINLNEPHVQVNTKLTRLSLKSIEAENTRQDKQNVEKLKPTNTPIKRTRFSSQPSESPDRHRDDLAKLMDGKLTSHLTKRTRFSSQSSEIEAKSLNDSSFNKLLMHKPSDLIIKRTCLPTKPTDPEDSCQDSPHDIQLSHTKRKKLRKTLEDIKKSSQKPHPDTDSDEDYRDFDSINCLEDDNEFLGFDENSAGYSKQKKDNEPVNAENKSQKTSSTTKATKGGTLKNWLTTGKAISPTFNKDPPVNRRQDNIITRGIPLKKRWDKAVNLNEETDITDDTSPADDEEEKDSVRGLKTVIESNTAILGNKNIKFNKLKDTNHTFLEPRPVATKVNTGTDSDCQELSTQRSTKRNRSSKKDLETHKSLDIPAIQTFKTPENSKETCDLTSEGVNSKTKAQDENSKTAANFEKSLLKVLDIEDLTSNKRKQKLSTEEDSNITQESLTKPRSSNTRTNKRLNSRISLEKTGPAAQSDVSTEDELNKTQDSLNKSRVSDSNITKDDSPGPSNKIKSPAKKISFEEALNISSQFDKSPIKKATTSKKSRKLCVEDKKILTIDTKAIELQTQEIPSKTKKTKAAKEAHPDLNPDKAQNLKTEDKPATKTTDESLKSKSPRKKKQVTASDSSENLMELKSTEIVEPKWNKRPSKLEDSEDESSPQIPKKKGRKRKIIKMDDSSEDESTTNSIDLNTLKPITTPHLPTLKNENSLEILTPSKRRKAANVDATTVNFNPRLLLITKREQIDTDEILTEPNPGTGPIQCGLCLMRTTSVKHYTLHLAEHYGVGWQDGQEKLNVENRTTVFTTITNYFKSTEIKGLSCRMCKKLYRSALGLITHLESCGTPALRVVCEYCKKDYTKLTMTVHIRSCPERTKLEKSLTENAMAKEEPQEEVFSNTGRLKRHSTIKAETKLKVIGAELQQNTEEAEFQPKDHLRFVPPLDMEEVHTKWSQDLQKFAKGFCPKKICKFNSPNMEELENHITECKFIKTGYFCNFCKRSACFETEEFVIKHILKYHKPSKEESDDSDADVNTEAEQSSDDDNDLSEGVNEDESENVGTDEDDVIDKKKGSKVRRIKQKAIGIRNINPETISVTIRKKVYDTRALDVSKEAIGKWKNFLSSNYSSKPLFPHLTCHYSIIKNQDFAKYLPSQVSSMKFCLENTNKINTSVGQPDRNIEWKELKRFETMESKPEIFSFLGAPVKFCFWIPLPANVEEQYLVVGYRKEMFNFIKFNQPKPHHTVLIIFKVTQEKRLPKLELHYGLVINDGPVHGVQFIPSGGYNQDTNRLGLMAVATINSAIKVYSLPIKVDTEECDKIENVTLIDVLPSFELNVDVMDQQQTDHVLMTPQCLEICWSEFSGHNHIFASFSNGFIGIWDITDDPQENLNRFVVENVVYYSALNYFYMGEKGSNCMALHYDTNGPRWLAVSAKYRKFVIYDIQNFMQPLILKDDCNKNVLRCLQWSPVWGPMFGAYCDSIPNNGRCITTISANNIIYSQQRLENMVSAVTYVHYSPVTNLLVGTADNGDILFGDPQELHYDYPLGKQFSAPRRVISAMDVKQLDNEAIVRPQLQKSKIDIKLPSDWTMHESDYKDKYGLVFNPLLKLKEETKNKYFNDNRRAPLNITPLMRINTVRCNLNLSAKRLVAAGYENGFIRIIYFSKDVQFNGK